MHLPRNLIKKANLSANAEKKIIAEFHPATFEKGDYLFRQDELCQHIYFIEKGLSRLFQINEKGKEITIWFAKEHQFITAIDSFYQRIPTQNNCELLEDTEVWSISFSQLETMLAQNHDLSRFAFYVLFEITQRLSQTATTFKFQTAQQKYQALLEEAPEIFNRTQLNYIASYLGITPETLSRLRSEKYS